MAVVPAREARKAIMMATQYSGITTHDAGDDPGGGQIADAANTDHLERIDLLVDPHRAHLRGGGPAPMVADNATEAVPGTISRTLKYADANPVRASIPTDANWL